MSPEPTRIDRALTGSPVRPAQATPGARRGRGDGTAFRRRMAQSWWSQPAAPVTQTVAVTVWPGRARTLKADSDGGNLRAAAVNRRDGLSPFKEMLFSACSPPPRLEQDARPASRLSITADSTKRLLEFRTFHRAGRSEAESEQAVAGTDSHPAPCPASPHRYSLTRNQTVHPSSGAYAVGDAGAGASAEGRCRLLGRPP